MPFECKKYHKKCKASCCSMCPIPKPIWERNQDKIQREPQKIILIKTPIVPLELGTIEESVLPVTASYKCAFLKADLECAIYDDRPEVCRKYGDESHKMMCCPMQDANGNER